MTKVTYSGDNAAIRFDVKGADLVLASKKAVEVTKAQAEELQSRPFVKKLIKKKLISFDVETVPDTKPEKLEELTKDELLEIAETKGLDVNNRTAKAGIITAIEESRK